jgi:hypothetical protein
MDSSRNEMLFYHLLYSHLLFSFEIFSSGVEANARFAITPASGHDPVIFFNLLQTKLKENFSIIETFPVSELL